MELILFLLFVFFLPFKYAMDGTMVPLPNDQTLPTDHTLTTNNRVGNLSSTRMWTTTSPDERLGDIGLLQDLKIGSTCETVDSGIIAKLNRHIRHCLKNGQSVIICYEGAKVMKLSRRFSKGLTNESVKLGKICTEKAREDGANVLYEGIVVRPTDQLIRMEIHAFMDFHLTTAGGYVEDYAPLKGLDIALTLVSNGQMFYSMCGKFLFLHENVYHTTLSPQIGPIKSGIHHTTRRTPSCIAEWKGAKVAKILDMYNVTTDSTGGRHLVKMEPKYALRVGVLQKPNHAIPRQSFIRDWIKRAHKKETEKWMPKLISKMLENSVLDSQESMHFDYLEIGENIHNSVEVLVHTCWDVVFVSALREGNSTTDKDIQKELDWSRDFEFLDDCALQANEEWEVMERKPTELHKTWPNKMHLKVGYEMPPNQSLTRQQQLAAMFKYSLSPARRPFYLNNNPKNYSDTNPFMDGSYIMPPKLGVEPMHRHHITVYIGYPRDWVITYGIKYYFQLRQHTILCDRYERGLNVMRDLKIFLPRMVGVELKRDKTLKTLFDYITSVKVDPHPEFHRDPKDWNTYDPKEWKEE